MGNITLPPQRINQEKRINPKISTTIAERKILDVINKGGAPTKNIQLLESNEIKQINIKLLASEIDTIRELRERLPKASRGGKRLSISLHDWIVEAVQEKIKRDIKRP